MMESRICHLLALWLWQGRVQKNLCLPFFVGESCPPGLALMSDTSVPPCMPLVPFKLIPQCWSSEGVSLSKSVWEFYKSSRNFLGLQKFLPLTQSPLVFVARSFGDLSSWHWNPGLRGPEGQRLLDPEIALLNFYLPPVDVEPACSASLPLLPVWMDVVSLIHSCSIPRDF